MIRVYCGREYSVDCNLNFELIKKLIGKKKLVNLIEASRKKFNENFTAIFRPPAYQSNNQAI